MPLAARQQLIQAGAQGVPTTPKVDKDAPTTAAFLSGLQGNNSWYTGPVMVSLIATDIDGPSDIASTSYSVDGDASVAYSAPFTISSDGIHTIQFGSVDQAGNTETLKSITIKIDQTPPTISVLGEILPSRHEDEHRIVQILISGKTTDLTSGVDVSSATFIVLDEDGIAAQTNGSLALAADGTYSLTVSFKRTADHKEKEEERRGKACKVVVSAKDNAGNQASLSKTIVADREDGGGNKERREFGKLHSHESIKNTLNALLTEDELEERWHYFWNHKDPMLRWKAFELYHHYRYGKPVQAVVGQEESLPIKIDINAIPKHRVPA